MKSISNKKENVIRLLTVYSVNILVSVMWSLFVYDDEKCELKNL